jgi:hypothetical protein
MGEPDRPQGFSAGHRDIPLIRSGINAKKSSEASSVSAMKEEFIPWFF